MTKAELYHVVDSCRTRFFPAVSRDPLCIQRACQAHLGLEIDFHAFKTKGLRGVAFVREGIICLDAKMSPVRQKFYCAHEAFHVLLHAELSWRFRCYDDRPALHDDYLEWQANEAAAELLIPHRTFLRKVSQAAAAIGTGRDFLLLRAELSDYFGVTPAMVKTRFDSLKYELIQCLAGVPIDHLTFMSEHRQRTRGITAVSMNDYFESPHSHFSMPEIAHRLYQ